MATIFFEINIADQSAQDLHTTGELADVNKAGVGSAVRMNPPDVFFQTE